MQMQQPAEEPVVDGNEGNIALAHVQGVWGSTCNVVFAHGIGFKSKMLGDFGCTVPFFAKDGPSVGGGGCSDSSHATSFSSSAASSPLPPHSPPHLGLKHIGTTLGVHCVPCEKCDFACGATCAISVQFAHVQIQTAAT